MKVVCILCDKIFQPDKRTEKKIRKYPHMIQLCPECHERIKDQVLARSEQNQSSNV